MMVVLMRGQMKIVKLDYIRGMSQARMEQLARSIINRIGMINVRANEGDRWSVA